MSTQRRSTRTSNEPPEEFGITPGDMERIQRFLALRPAERTPDAL